MGAPEGYPYFVSVARRSDSVLVLTQFIGSQSRCASAGKFEDMADKMLRSNNMRTLPEQIVTVQELALFIGYIKDERRGVVIFVFTPKEYNKSTLRKLMKELSDQFGEGLEEANVSDCALGACAPKDLNKRSQIKHRITAAIDKYGDGATLAEQMLSSIDANKAILSSQIDETVAKNSTLEEQVEQSEYLDELAEDFSDKTEQHGCCVIA